jgi:membrane protein DedA with SNARE-associated domain
LPISPTTPPPDALGGLLSLGGGGAWLVLLGLVLATFLAEDLTCIAAGLLVAKGTLTFLPAATACTIGIFVGDLLLVYAGRSLGRHAVERAPLSWLISPAALERAERWFEARGVRMVVLSRFIPGSRLPLYVAAGVLRAPIRPIAIALGIASGIWTPMLVGLSWMTGGAIAAWLERYEAWALTIVVVSALLALLVVKVLLPALTWRGRRLLLSRWRRWTRWEFWPVWLFNIPVFLNWIRLGIRHRDLALFTAANPGIPAGGFVLESKSEILGKLPAAVVPRYERIELPEAPNERAEAVEAARRRLELDYPFVGKPDIGERGAGVAILRGPADVERWLHSAPPVVLVQQFASGEEYGVFYLRRPSANAGEIFSITAKSFPAVTGDGTSTLEHLVLADDRAVCMAPLYLERNADRLDLVPAAGERIELTDIGNHCRGTVFRDGRALATPQLAAALDAIAGSFPGFYFGRFDLRCPSAAALAAGRDLRIIELNGVTSEATHIYEPGASLLSAWRTLFAQWRLAFEIARENVDRGARPVRIRHLIGLLVERRRGSATIPGVREA